MLITRQVVLQMMVLLVGTKAAAFESRWTMGLHVATERLSGQTGVNGVLFRVQRATGRDVHVLVDRMLTDWRSESGGGDVIPLTAAGWSMYSRIHRGESEVVQWRGVGADSELLWSVTDLRSANGSPPAGTVPLPLSCRWLPPVHGSVQGSAFIQTTGSCPGQPQEVSAEFERLLSSRGWRTRRWASGVLQMERGQQKAQIVLIPPPGSARSAGTSAVVLELDVQTEMP